MGTIFLGKTNDCAYEKQQPYYNSLTLTIRAAQNRACQPWDLRRFHQQNAEHRTSCVTICPKRHRFLVDSSNGTGSSSWPPACPMPANIGTGRLGSIQGRTQRN
jgi:hypothetical protein